jgi:hypothetical protein
MSQPRFQFYDKIEITDGLLGWTSPNHNSLPKKQRMSYSDESVRLDLMLPQGTPIPRVWSAADLADKEALPAKALWCYRMYDDFLDLTEVDDERAQGVFSESSHHSRTQPKKGCAKAQRKGEKTAHLKSARGERLWNEPLSEFDTIQSYIAAEFADEMREREQHHRRQQQQKQRQQQQDSSEARRLRQRKRRAAARARTHALRAQQKH